MKYIAEYIALVQFAGAFNFVFLKESFHKQLSDHFANISKKQKGDFETVKNKITTDITTFASYPPVECKGMSNQHELEEIRDKYGSILSNINSVETKIANKIASQKQPQYSRQFFLLIGLYSIVAIFFMCKIGHMEAHKIDTSTWCNTFSFLNLIMIVWWGYFLVSELIWFTKKESSPNPFLFSPSFSWTMLLFCIVFCCIIIRRNALPIVRFEQFDVYIVIAISLIAFVSSIGLFILTNAKPWFLTNSYVIFYRCKLWILTKKRKHALSPYQHLKVTSITIS